LSEHAHDHAAAFANTTLSLGLPLGQFVWFFNKMGI
jgi:hypothetical protein